MGRNKIKIEKIQNERNRLVTFIKRKKGLFKKAMELSLLCDAQVFIAVISNENQLSIVTTTENPDTFIEKNLQFPLKPAELFTIKDVSNLFDLNIFVTIQYSSLYISKNEVTSLSQQKEALTSSNLKQDKSLNQLPTTLIQKEIIPSSFPNHFLPLQPSFHSSIPSYVYFNSIPYNQQFITAIQNTSEDKNNNIITNNNLMTTYINNMHNNYYYLSQQQNNNNVSPELNVNNTMLKNKRIRYENDNTDNVHINKGNVTNIYNNYLGN